MYRTCNYLHVCHISNSATSRPTYTASIMPFQHTQGKDGLLGLQ